MAKIIHASQMLETPQINILNDNVIDSVNYAYNNVTMLSATDTSSVWGTEYGFIKPEFMVNKMDFNVKVNRTTSPISLSSDYDILQFNSNNFNYYILIVPFNFSVFGGNPLNVLNENLGFKVTSISNYVVDTTYNTSTTTRAGVIGSTNTANYDNVANIDSNLSYEQLKSYVQANAVTSGIQFTSTGKQFSGYIITEPDRNRNFLTYDISNISVSISIYFRNILKNGDTTQIDTNSSITLEANELITQDTKVDGVQISEYIANDIKSHYENGKATISMQVIDDGTDYDVNDIIQPMKTRLETVTETFEPRVIIPTVGDDTFNKEMLLFHAGRNFFVINTITSDSSVTRELKVFSSSDGLSWKEVKTNLLSLIGSLYSTGWNVWYSDNKVFIKCKSQYMTHIICTEDGVNYSLGVTSSGDYDGAVYYKDKYYAKSNDGKLYEFNLSGNGIRTLVSQFDCTIGTLAVFRDKLYVIGQQSSGTLVASSSDAINFDIQILSYAGQYVSHAVSDSMLIALAQSNNSVISTTDGFNWEQNETISGGVKIAYNSAINAFIAVNLGATQISYDNGVTWQTLLNDGGNFYEHRDNINVCMLQNNQPRRFVFYNIVDKEVEYPLLTNQDGSAKTFEITSSELVFDGSAYYNIDAVEKIIPTASLQNGSSTLSVNVTTSSDDTYAFMTINESQIYQYPIHKITSIDVSIKTSNSSVLTGQMVYDENTDEWEFIQYFNDTDYFIQCFFYKEDSNYIFDIDSYTSETLPTTYSGTVTVNLQYYE